MADLDGSIIGNTGTFDVPTITGQEYLVCMKSISNFECSLTYFDAGSGGFSAVDNSTFGTSGGIREARIVAPSTRMQIVCSSLSDEITVTFIPVLKS